MRRAIRPNTRVLFTESVSNPHMLVADLYELGRIAKEHVLAFIVDNAFLSPYLLRPSEQGADLVVHAATKYLSGHGDTIAGALAGSRERLLKGRLKLDALGQAMSPRVEWVRYPGLASHPQHEVAMRLLPEGCGGMLSFKIAGAPRR